MKTLVTLIALVFVGLIPIKSQQVVINEKLLAQLTKNQAVRLSSDKLFLILMKSKNSFMMISKVRLLRLWLFKNISIANLPMLIWLLNRVSNCSTYTSTSEK